MKKRALRWRATGTTNTRCAGGRGSLGLCASQVSTGGQPVEGCWDESTIPETADEWRRVFITYLNHFWADRDKGIRWMHDFIANTIPKRCDAVLRVREHAARRITEGGIERITRHRSQITRELVMHFATLTMLKARPESEVGPPSAGTNP